MRATLILFAMSAAFGQDVGRVFQLHHIDAEKDIFEFATLIRTISDNPQVAADTTAKTLAVHGTATQIAVAEWLFTELDRQTVPDSVSQEFKVSNNADDVVHVFYLPNTATIQDFQEVATTIRTIAEIRRVYTFNTLRALTVRGTADQVAAAGFMIRELDQPAGAKRTDSREFRMTGPGDPGETAVRVFYLPYAATVQQFQEVATLVRTIAEVRRVFTYNAPKALVVRGTADQMAAVDWMVHELGKPVDAATLASQPYTMEDPHGENIVRVFYVKDVPTVAAFQQVATQIRTATNIRRVFTYNATMAMAVRGTAAQIAMAEQMLQDRARQVAAK
jgi:type II secretory pathway component GspD/PulD (secretin)